jgi:hypothetical protein
MIPQWAALLARCAEQRDGLKAPTHEQSLISTGSVQRCPEGREGIPGPRLVGALWEIVFGITAGLLLLEFFIRTPPLFATARWQKKRKRPP